jgi:quinol monooxygenase YgiN
MYGTVATFNVQPGKVEELERLMRDSAEQISGLIFEYTYRTDADPNTLMIVVGFESKDAYWANAKSPEQHKRYEQYRALLAKDPEWHDGEIISSMTGATV